MLRDKYADVVVGLPLDKTFQYTIPERLADSIVIGKRVWVPFKERKIVGYVVGFSVKPQIPTLRPVYDVIDDVPILDSEMLTLTKWIADYYCCSYGQAVEAAIPKSLKRGKIAVKARTAVATEIYPPSYKLSPTVEQEDALKEILKNLDKGKFKVFLLHGITASGKTEIYLQAIERTLAHGKSSIVLVPEISLTPQTVERFKSRFGEEVAVIHSRLTGSKHFAEWKRMKDGLAHIVVGARSAIFSPLKNVGLIIIDEEHETSYKQEDVPRYHVREVAIKRAELASCAVILGSATPSLESYYNALEHRFKLLVLTKRIEERELPEVTVVDMRKEFGRRNKQTVLSRPLHHAIVKALGISGQVMLFLNRRGFSTFANCRKCGFIVKCKRCDSPLVYHFDMQKLICHYCARQFDLPEICPQCESSYIKYFGMGTERVESEVHRGFPQAKIDRMDSDATKKRGAHERILGDFKEHKIDTLVGTQMIAKGLDFPKVLLVGVVSADVSLNLPDFRASERTFNLLTQVAGRAGRGAEKGEVIVQTYNPEHYAIKYAAKHDYVNFYKKEIALRKELDFPPFTHIIKLTLRASREVKVKEAAEALARLLRKKSGIKGLGVLGPAPSPITRVRGQYRWNVILKGKDPQAVSLYLKSILPDFRKGTGVFIVVDVDPISL